jgi:hypothetical protein
MGHEGDQAGTYRPVARLIADTNTTNILLPFVG